jgi:hypothetical protein
MQTPITADENPLLSGDVEGLVPKADLAAEAVAHIVPSSSR